MSNPLTLADGTTVDVDAATDFWEGVPRQLLEYVDDLCRDPAGVYYLCYGPGWDGARLTPQDAATWLRANGYDVPYDLVDLLATE